jgi:hypothetical protein
MTALRAMLLLVAVAVLAVLGVFGWAAFTPVTPENVQSRLSRTCAVVMTAYLATPAAGQGTGARPWTVCACVAAELGKDPVAAAPLVEAVRGAFVTGDGDDPAFARALRELGAIGPACARQSAGR